MAGTPGTAQLGAVRDLAIRSKAEAGRAIWTPGHNLERGLGRFAVRSGPEEGEQLIVVRSQVSVTVGHRAGDERPDEGDGQVAQCRHGLRPVARACTAAILIVGDVADVVQGLDTPVAAHQGQDLPFSRPVQGQAGHTEDDFMALVAIAEQGSPLHTKALGGVGEAQSGDVLGQLDGPGLDPAMALVTLGVSGGKAPNPGRRAAGALSSGCL